MTSATRSCPHSQFCSSSRSRCAPKPWAARKLASRRVRSADSPNVLRYSLVSLGSAVFVLAALDGGTADSTSRVIQGIITGIGFLGAGTIIHGRDEHSVRGLTTAAAVWLAAAIGIACAMANWALVLAGSVFGLLVLALEGFEARLRAALK